MVARKLNNELLFALDPTGGVPFYKQIIQQVEMAIADGRLRAGTQLPTVRGLAVQLQINPNTVAKAYNELEIRGIVNTQQGTGTFVSDKTIEMSDVEREQILSGIARDLLAKLNAYGFSLRDIVTYLDDRLQEDES